MASSQNLVFYRIPPARENNLRPLGGLRLDLSRQLGPRAVIDLTQQKRHAVLTRDLIAAAYEHLKPARVMSDFSVSSYGLAIREVLEYCQQVEITDNFRLHNVDENFLVSYRAYLKVKFVRQKSSVIRRRYGNLTRLLEAGKVLGLAGQRLQIPRNFEHKRDGDRSEPYPLGTLLDLEKLCRGQISELTGRLAEGRECLKLGCDPRGRRKKVADHRKADKPAPEARPWNQLPNLIWYVVNVLGGRYLSRSELLAEGGHSSFINAMCGVWKGIYRVNDVYGRLYPLTEDLIPFIILLAKKVGRNESSILNLSRDCLSEINGEYYIFYEKKRGSKKLYSKKVDNEGPYSTVALINTVEKITQPLVPYAEEVDRDRLFLGLTTRSTVNKKIKPFDPSYIIYQMNSVGGWFDKFGFRDPDGERFQFSFIRMRKSYLSRRYKKHGVLGKVSRDAAHTLWEQTVGYVDNESMEEVHEQSVVRGIEAAIAVTAPIVIPTEDFEEAAKIITTDKESVARIFSGDQDVLFASCKDFYNRPGGKANTPCDQPWACFGCSNCIITRHVLPRVIAFRNFIKNQREELILEDWQAKFGQAWKVITEDVLPKFAKEVVVECETLAGGEVLYIPMTLKVRKKSL